MDSLARLPLRYRVRTAMRVGGFAATVAFFSLKERPGAVNQVLGKTMMPGTAFNMRFAM